MKLIKLCILSLLIAQSASAEIVKNSKNTLKDTKTNYIWQDTKETKTNKRTFSEAVEYCKNLELDGRKSWELPGFMELFSIIDTKRYNPSISKSFKNITPKDYWTTKTFGNATSNEAFVVNFVSGAFNRVKMNTKSFVRCYQKTQ